MIGAGEGPRYNRAKKRALYCRNASNGVVRLDLQNNRNAVQHGIQMNEAVAEESFISFFNLHARQYFRLGILHLRPQVEPNQSPASTLERPNDGRQAKCGILAKDPVSDSVRGF